jgi:hypothetical protein
MKEKQFGNQQLRNTQMILFCCHMKLQRAKLSILEPHSHKTVTIMDGIQKETGPPQYRCLENYMAVTNTR